VYRLTYLGAFTVSAEIDAARSKAVLYLAKTRIFCICHSGLEPESIVIK
jgi:hypothetical protein